MNEPVWENGIIHDDLMEGFYLKVVFLCQKDGKLKKFMARRVTPFQKKTYLCKNECNVKPDYVISRNKEGYDQTGVEILCTF